MPVSDAATAVRAYLAAPDQVLPDSGPVHPLRTAVAAALGLAGAAIFAVVGLGGLGDTTTGASALAYVIVPPAALLLGFPPLALVTSLRSGPVDLAKLAAVAVSGPTVAGAALGAATPLLLVYRTTDANLGYAVLVAVLAGASLVAGALGALSNARRAGTPAAPAVLVHYAATVWAAAVLAVFVAPEGP